MKLNKLLLVGLAAFGLMAAGCAKHEVSSASSGGSMHGASTHGVKSMGAKPSTNSVYFAFDSSALNAAGSATLDAYAAWLNGHGGVRVTVEGNCDQRGSREYNLALGQQRADSVKDYLVARGVSASRVDTVSFGEERPVCTSTGAACWAQNRHADIVSR